MKKKDKKELKVDNVEKVDKKKSKKERKQEEKQRKQEEKERQIALKEEQKRAKKEKKAKKKSKGKKEDVVEVNKEVKETLDFGKDIDDQTSEDNKKERPISKGARRLKDLIAPCGFDRSEEDCLGVGNKKVRSFVVNGYPGVVSVGWLDKIYNSEQDLDVSFHIVPADERSALDEINMEITKQEAQYQHELKSGSIKNRGKIEARIEQLYAQRAKLEQNQEKLYHSCIALNLHSTSKERLDKETYTLTQTLAARKIDLMDAYLRQDDCYKSAGVFGTNYMEDMYRSINTGGIVASFPFYNAHISHKNGIFLGLNMVTGSPIFVDYYDRTLLNTGNINVFGASGSGKTFLVSLMTCRSTIKDIKTAIVDPEGEYVRITHALGGKHITLAPDSKTRVNPFDISEEFDVEKGEYYVGVKAKIDDLLNLIAVMAQGLDAEQKSVTSLILKDLYEVDWGINSKPESLYEQSGSFNKETGEFIHAGRKKVMPRFSDFYRKLKKYADESGRDNLRRLVNSLVMYTQGNVYDLFDCYTTEDLSDLKDSPVITFDVSRLESDQLRPLGMYVAMTWIWESFVKKDHRQKKRVIVDEAWMLCDPSMAGSEYTAGFLNLAARRCRKRNAGLLIASQSFNEFIRNPQGEAVLMNASVNMFLRTEAMAIDAVQRTFKLSDGEKQFLMSANKGQVLIRMGNEACVGLIVPFEYEKNLIENPFGSKKEKGEWNNEE